MGNSGQIYAHDSDARRLADTIRRGQRAGVRNLQIRSPIEGEPLKGLEGKLDLVFVDAPCTGSGTWRRHPDAKWRLSPDQLAKRQIEQDAVLADASDFVKPGGRLIYVTCSLLAEENEDRVAAFVERHPGFSVKPIALAGVEQHLTPEGYLRLTPHRAGTDGFFAAVIERGSYAPSRLLPTGRPNRNDDAGEPVPMTAETHHQRVLIVDFGSQVTQLIARRVREAGVYCEIHPFDKAEAMVDDYAPSAIILSGGPASVLEADSPASGPSCSTWACRCCASATASSCCATCWAARSRAATPASSAAPN